MKGKGGEDDRECDGRTALREIGLSFLHKEGSTSLPSLIMYT